MVPKYSKNEFEGYAYRFIVKFSVDEDWRNDINITIYSNSSSYEKLEEYIEENKSDKVVSFVIEHRSTQEQDEHMSKFLDELLNDL